MTVLRIHVMQQLFTLSGPAMAEALHDTPVFREFAGLDWDTRLPDESTILRFRHLLAKHKPAEQIVAVVNDRLRDRGLLLEAATEVDATLISAPSSSKSANGERDPGMVSGASTQPRTAKKGNQWYFGTKARIGMQAQSGLVHTVQGTAANANDVAEATRLPHGEGADAFGDAAYRGADTRPDATDDVIWHLALRLGKRRALEKTRPVNNLIDQIERIKPSVRGKAEHPFPVVKRRFGHTKLRHRGLKKNTAQLMTLLALSVPAKLWIVRKKRSALDGQFRPQRLQDT